MGLLITTAQFFNIPISELNRDTLFGYTKEEYLLRELGTDIHYFEKKDVNENNPTIKELTDNYYDYLYLETTDELVALILFHEKSAKEDMCE